MYFKQLRRSIVHHLARDNALLKCEIEADELYFGEKRKGKRGRGNRNITMVGEIRKRRGKISIRIVRDVSAESFMTENAKKVRRGLSLVKLRHSGRIISRFDLLLLVRYSFKPHLSPEVKARPVTSIVTFAITICSL